MVRRDAESLKSERSFSGNYATLLRIRSFARPPGPFSLLKRTSQKKTEKENATSVCLLRPVDTGGLGWWSSESTEGVSLGPLKASCSALENRGDRRVHREGPDQMRQV